MKADPKFAKYFKMVAVRTLDSSTRAAVTYKN
jgi:hypothetical protein